MTDHVRLFTAAWQEAARAGDALGRATRSSLAIAAHDDFDLARELNRLLLAEVDALREDAALHREGYEHDQAEIERLRARDRQWSRSLNIQGDEFDVADLRAEVVRLEEALTIAEDANLVRMRADWNRDHAGGSA